MDNDINGFTPNLYQGHCEVKSTSAERTVKECQLSRYTASTYIKQDASGAEVAEPTQVGGGFGYWYTFSIVSEKKGGKVQESIVGNTVLRGIAG